MIPLKLELKNFLSYGDTIQTIDFKDYSLICLSGKNGNGKSAILDAITWSLWGQARKISGSIKPDDGLLRLGQTKMMVSLEFIFVGNIYRVRREYSKTYGKPLIYLDFEIFDSKKDRFVPLTEKTIKLTQEKIEKLLGLDYLTFTNTAFLRQGGADDFSKRSSKERKKIISNILGFSRYDELTNLALRKSKKMHEDIRLNQRLQENLEKEVLNEADLKSSNISEKEKLSLIDKDIIKLDENFKRIENDFAQYFKNKDKFLFFSGELDKIKNIFSVKITEYQDQVVFWKKTHYQFIKRDSLEALEFELKRLTQRDKGFVKNQKKLLVLQEEFLKNKEQYQKLGLSLKEKSNLELNKFRFEKQKIDLELDQFLKSKTSKEAELKSLKILKDKDTIEKNNLSKALIAAKKHEVVIGKSQSSFEKRRSFYQLMIQRGNWLKGQLTDLKDKFDIIKKQESPACPLCEQVLTVRRKSFLSNKFLGEIKLAQYKLLRPTNIIKRLKEVLLEQNELVKSLKDLDIVYKQKINKYNELEIILKDYTKKIERLNKDLVELEINIKNYNEKSNIFSKQLKDLEKNIKNSVANNFNNKDLISIFNKINSIEAEKKLLDYNEVEYKKNHESLVLGEQKIDMLGKLDDLKLLQSSRRAKILSIYMQLKELKISKLKIETDIKSLNFDLKKEEILIRDKQEIKKQLEELKIKKEGCLQQLTLQDHEIKRIEKLKKELNDIKLKLVELSTHASDYHFLSQAFGKNGIQALLIEQVIPQIEEEANNILSRLTDNQAQIFIESLRDLKSGGVKETLDIKISDAVGVRPYEMFSGGEAFRIDFALRIAISKLLARRAGVALQTLIIDEGFGSQDEDGLSRLMDAIYAIREDFSKIIIVSHLESLKDNFPVHFVVQKNSSGSFVSVYERG